MLSELMMSDISRFSRVNNKVALLLEALGSLLNINGNLNNDWMNRGYYNICNYKESITNTGNSFLMVLFIISGNSSQILAA
jgi:putative heme iron utilization protein